MKISFTSPSSRVLSSTCKGESPEGLDQLKVEEMSDVADCVEAWVNIMVTERRSVRVEKASGLKGLKLRTYFS